MFRFNMPLQKSEGGNDNFVVRSVISSTSLDLQGEKVQLEALKRVASKLAGKPILKDHKPLVDETVGIIERAWLDGAKLIADSRISKTEEKLKTKIDEGIIKSVSIGGEVIDYEELGDGTILLKDIDIREVSFTPVPANPDANVYSIITKSMGKNSPRVSKDLQKQNTGDNMTKDEIKENLVKSDEVQDSPVKEDANESSEEKQVVEQENKAPVEEAVSEDNSGAEKNDAKEDENKEDAEGKEEVKEAEKSEASEIETLKKALSDLTDEIAELKKNLTSKEVSKSVTGGRLSVVKSTQVSDEGKFLKFLNGFKVKK